MLEPQLLDIMIAQFRNEKVSNHGSIPITIDCNVVAFIVFEEGFHQPIKRTKQSVFLDKALVWSPAPDSHGKTSGVSTSANNGPVSPSLAHYVSMMSEHVSGSPHDLYHLWPGVEVILIAGPMGEREGALRKNFDISDKSDEKHDQDLWLCLGRMKRMGQNDPQEKIPLFEEN
ncbi:hypothetical protein TNCV_2537491 [Trichonephila clavipes]|nr:hypothetical protein TNCV_2537491 [Trichonephila clavipes]